MYLRFAYINLFKIFWEKTRNRLSSDVSLKQVLKVTVTHGYTCMYTVDIEIQQLNYANPHVTKYNRPLAKLFLWYDREF